MTFHGWKDHSLVQNHLSESDILSFPSIREFGGGVVLEAMALGVMPLIVNYGGPAELITPECGLTIEMGSKDEIIERLKRKIEYLIENREVIDRLGNNARKVVEEHFTWEKKAQKTQTLYNWLIENRTEKPDLIAKNSNGNKNEI